MEFAFLLEARWVMEEQRGDGIREGVAEKKEDLI